MNTCDEALALLAERGGVLARRDHPRLRHALQWLCRTGRLFAIFPGVYCRPDDRNVDEVRLRAAVLWHPDGVLLGAAAAKISFLPKQRLDDSIVMATRRKRRAPQGIKLVRWEVPEDLVAVREGIRMSAPALTALDLCLRDDGATIDEVLRQGLASLGQLWSALRATRFRLGNPRRRELLLDSRDKPWSPAERRAHRVMRGAGLVGWISNLAVNLGGRRAVIDVAFEEFKVLLEIDGYEFHAYGVTKESRRQFEWDRWKGTELAAAGWIVLRVTWLQLTEWPEWVVRMVKKSLASRGWSPSGRRERRTARLALVS